MRCLLRATAQRTAVRHFDIVRPLCEKDSYSISMAESEHKGVLGRGVPTVQRSLLFSSIGVVVEWFDFMVYLSLPRAAKRRSW
jgi:hypothetical protein